MRTLVALVFAAGLLRGGDPGTVQGIVRDSTGAAMHGAKVSVQQLGSAFRSMGITDARGEFRLLLPQGDYKIVVQQEGFLAGVIPAVRIPANRLVIAEFLLRTDKVFESITVSAPYEQTPVSESRVERRRLDDPAFRITPEGLGGLPQNDRTAMGLAALAQGVLSTPASRGEAGQLASFGARPNTNDFEVDGAPVNNGINGAGWPSQFTSGTLPALTALGTSHNLAVPEAIAEVEVFTQFRTSQTSSRPGAFVRISTKRGGERWHGSLFGANRPRALGASDWFSNRYGLPNSAPTLSDFGASIGGPLGRWSVFAAAERLTLTQSYAWTTTVPSLAVRQVARTEVQPLLNMFPAPNGRSLTFGAGELVGNKARAGGLYAFNARVDRDWTDRTRSYVRVSAAPSWADNGFLQTNDNRYWQGLGTLGITHDRGSWVHDFRFTASRTLVDSMFRPDGGPREFYGTAPSVAADYASLRVGGAGSVARGAPGSNRQDQLHVSYSLAWNAGKHEIHWGADYSLLRAGRRGATKNMIMSFNSPDDLAFGPLAPLWMTYSETRASQARIPIASGFVQDHWRFHPAIEIGAGMRWTMATPPEVAPGANVYLVGFSGAFYTYKRAITGTRAWPSRVLADPRVSVAWRLRGDGSTMLRAGWSRQHDPYFSAAMDQINGTPYYAQRMVLEYGSNSPSFFGGPIGYGVAQGLRAPVHRQWDVAVEQRIGEAHVVSLAYSSLSATGLLRRTTTTIVDGPPLGQVTYASNEGHSRYDGLTASYRLSLVHGFSGSTAYTWSHAIDNGSFDSALFWTSPGRSPNADRGSSDFDVRQNFSAALSYVSAGRDWLTRGWTIGTVFRARTGFPITVMTSETTSGFAVENAWRADLAPGKPIWVADAGAPGGKRINAEAFRRPASIDGTLGRNAIRGFGMWQADAALERVFGAARPARWTLRLEAYNVFNHTQFADPVRFLNNPTFGTSGSLLNLMMGGGSPASGKAPALQAGGPRSLQGIIRLSF